MSNKRLYVSYISNDRDIKGILALNYNLSKLNSKYRFGCIVMEEVSSKSIEKLKKQNIRVFECNLYNSLKKFNITKEHYNKINSHHLFGKFFIFGLSEYDNIIYLDSDTMILNNIDHLFDKIIPKNTLWMVPDMQATPEYKKIILIKDRFNSGVIVTKPDKKLLDLCFKTLFDLGMKFISNKNIFVSDQYILDLLYRKKSININKLDISYNIHPILVQSAKHFKLIDKIYIIHFMIRPKPWEFLEIGIDVYKHENRVCQQIFQLWLNLYLEMIQTIYLSQPLIDTNIESYHWGHYNTNNDIEIFNKPIE